MRDPTQPSKTAGRDPPQGGPDTKASDTRSIKMSASPTHFRQLKSAADREGLPVHHYIKSVALKAARETK
jgi:hypothetical protein